LTVFASPVQQKGKDGPLFTSSPNLLLAYTHHLIIYYSAKSLAFKASYLIFISIKKGKEVGF